MMKIIDVIELNQDGINIEEAGNEFATRYFDDNGGLPDGNYDEDNIAGVWLLLDGKQDEYDFYAYRSIDDCTLVPVKSFVKENPYINELFYQPEDQDFVDGIEWGKLAEHFGVETEGSIGFDSPKRWKPNPDINDRGYYRKVDGEDKYIRVSGDGEHELIEEKDADSSVQFP